ncbi:hypothetical protein [Zunongwangia pacifica]|uniref:Viral A-type inclusion protein n=1 Tax=Zunongwangia pacifica TaxID=2911062 RepID=A0A9X2CNK0_9FLAO|nr:hypothetical protein [Zunongwangia pacifica]MCL6220635.1 hypothetical protein [Zunongwangia pacifica]
MKLINRLALLLSLALLAVSCAEDTSAKKEQYEELFHQVLDVHDEVMPKMGDISELSKDLKAIADTSATAEKYLKAEQKLQDADKLMMDWMHSFSDEFVKNKAKVQKMNNEELQEQIKALQEELGDVKAMQQAVNASIENARSLTN